MLRDYKIYRKVETSKLVNYSNHNFFSMRIGDVVEEVYCVHGNRQTRVNLEGCQTENNCADASYGGRAIMPYPKEHLRKLILSIWCWVEQPHNC
jgi:hypothetical protein